MIFLVRRFYDVIKKKRSGHPLQRELHIVLFEPVLEASPTRNAFQLSLASLSVHAGWVLILRALCVVAPNGTGSVSTDCSGRFSLCFCCTSGPLYSPHASMPKATPSGGSSSCQSPSFPCMKTPSEKVLLKPAEDMLTGVV